MFFLYVCSLSTWHCWNQASILNCCFVVQWNRRKKLFDMLVVSSAALLLLFVFQFKPLLWPQTMSFDWSGSIENWTVDRPKQTHVGTLHDQWTKANSCFIGKTVIKITNILKKTYTLLSGSLWQFWVCCGFSRGIQMRERKKGAKLFKSRKHLQMKTWFKWFDFIFVSPSLSRSQPLSSWSYWLRCL